MKRSKFITKFGAASSDLRKDTWPSLSNFVELKFRGLNHLHDDFNLSFLYDDVGQCEFANMHEKFTSTLPFINLFFAAVCHLVSGVSVFFATKCVDKPVDETFIGTTYDQVGGVVRNSSFTRCIGSTGQSSLSIDDTCHVGTNSIWVGFSSIFKSHINPFVNVFRYVYNNIIKDQPQRLSERGFNFFRLRQAIV